MHQGHAWKPGAVMHPVGLVGPVGPVGPVGSLVTSVVGLRGKKLIQIGFKCKCITRRQPGLGKSDF